MVAFVVYGRKYSKVRHMKLQFKLIILVSPLTVGGIVGGGCCCIQKKGTKLDFIYSS